MRLQQLVLMGNAGVLMGNARVGPQGRRKGWLEGRRPHILIEDGLACNQRVVVLPGEV